MVVLKILDRIKFYTDPRVEKNKFGFSKSATVMNIIKLLDSETLYGKN
mgnify:CR=1 FL=1